MKRFSLVSVYVICIFLWPALLVLASKEMGGAQAAEEEPTVVIVSADFLHACTDGDVPKAQALLQEHPDWVNGRSEQGETCLHVAGIHGQPAISRLLLQAGANPNVRSTFEYGLRMTPLSWNVYAGHVENARVLLQEGHADVNMDFDAMGPPGDAPRRLTCYDVILEILESFQSDGGDARQEAFLEMKTLLESFNAKMYKDLQQKRQQQAVEEPDL